MDHSTSKRCKSTYQFVHPPELLRCLQKDYRTTATLSWRSTSVLQRMQHLQASAYLGPMSAPIVPGGSSDPPGEACMSAVGNEDHGRRLSWIQALVTYVSRCVPSLRYIAAVHEGPLQLLKGAEDLLAF